MCEEGGGGGGSNIPIFLFITIVSVCDIETGVVCLLLVVLMWMSVIELFCGVCWYCFCMLSFLELLYFLKFLCICR